MTTAQPPLRLGEQLASAVCATKVVVVRAPGDRRPDLACGGAALIPAAGAPKSAPVAGQPVVTLLGKRYVNADDTVELLCTAPGTGQLTCDGADMTIKAAKPLPASD